MFEQSIGQMNKFHADLGALVGDNSMIAAESAHCCLILMVCNVVGLLSVCIKVLPGNLEPFNKT